MEKVVWNRDRPQLAAQRPSRHDGERMRTLDLNPSLVIGGFMDVDSA
jgi:hypothetical protein